MSANPPRCLVLNGSPHRDGNSMALADVVWKAAGHAGRVVHLYEENIMPCRGCGACAGGLCCPLSDAMPGLLAEIARSNVMLVASPLHFSSLSAPVIAFYSRLQPYWRHGAAIGPAARPATGPDRGALVVTAGSRYDGMFRPARSVTAAMFNTLGIHFAGMVTADNTDKTSVRENAAARAEARKLGELLWSEDNLSAQAFQETP